MKYSEDQAIAHAMATAQKNNPAGKTASETKMYESLSADFPDSAMTKDSSRGFDLTSIKAQYVIERLNDVLGVMNWTHGGEFQRTEDGVLFLGTLVVTIDGKTNRQFAPGYAAIKAGKNLGDAYKSAKTDSLSKAASMYGVGNAVFKGLVDPKTLGNKTSAAATTARAKKAETIATDRELAENATHASDLSMNKSSAAIPFKTRTKTTKAKIANDDI